MIVTRCIKVAKNGIQPRRAGLAERAGGCWWSGGHGFESRLIFR